MQNPAPSEHSLAGTGPAGLPRGPSFRLSLGGFIYNLFRGLLHVSRPLGNRLVRHHGTRSGLPLGRLHLTTLFPLCDSRFEHAPPLERSHVGQAVEAETESIRSDWTKTGLSSSTTVGAVCVSHSACCTAWLAVSVTVHAPGCTHS